MNHPVCGLILEGAWLDCDCEVRSPSCTRRTLAPSLDEKGCDGQRRAGRGGDRVRRRGRTQQGLVIDPRVRPALEGRNTTWAAPKGGNLISSVAYLPLRAVRDAPEAGPAEPRSRTDAGVGGRSVGDPCTGGGVSRGRGRRQPTPAALSAHGGRNARGRRPVVGMPPSEVGWWVRQPLWGAPCTTSSVTSRYWQPEGPESFAQSTPLSTAWLPSMVSRTYRTF